MLDSVDIQILVVPPWENAGDDHWMSHLQRKYPSIKRVEQRDWFDPKPDEWAARLGESISKQRRPVAVVAHSLGAATFARWAASGGRVDAAFLVAPPDLERPGTPQEIVGFGPLPVERFGFPSLLIASENDPYISIDRARFFADKWGSEFVNIGEAGHINTKSGHGEWPEGEKLVVRFLQHCFAGAALAEI